MSGTPPPGYSQPPPGYSQPPPGYSQPPPGYSQQPPQPVYAQPPPAYAAGGFAAPVNANHQGGCTKDRAVAITDIVISLFCSIGFFVSTSRSSSNDGSNNDTVTGVSVGLGLLQILSIAASICILCARGQVWPCTFWIVVNSLRFAANIIDLIVIGLWFALIPGILVFFVAWIIVFLILTGVYIALMVLICIHCNGLKTTGGVIHTGNATGFAPAPYQYQATYSATAVPPSAVQYPPTQRA